MSSINPASREAGMTLRQAALVGGFGMLVMTEALSSAN